ncbi:MAG: endonuclease III [Patescibacteria group bacterium]
MMKKNNPALLPKHRAAIVLRELKKLCPDAGMILKFSNSWELLVAVQLSAQCTDKKVNEVTKTLFKKYTTLDHYVQARSAEFQKDIFQTGFYKNKTKNILAAAKMVHETFHGKIPQTMQEMLTIPGVGRKTANVVLGNAYGIVEGIAVDTHVHRLSRLFGLTNQNDPNKIEQDLIKILPKKEWFSWTYRVIDYGRKYCTARCKHENCPIMKTLKQRNMKT